MDDLVIGSGIGWVEKYILPDGMDEQEFCRMIDAGLVRPYEIGEKRHNLWVTVGWTEILKLITGASTSHYDASNTLIGVGNDGTAAAAGNTALIGASTEFKGMLSSFPDTPASGLVNFKARFLTSEANFNWLEVCIKNSVSGVLWNRLVIAEGTKTSANIWDYNLQVGKA